MPTTSQMLLDQALNRLWSTAPDDSSYWRQLTRTVLDSLSARLDGDDEDERYFERVLAARPRLSKRVEALLAEHASLHDRVGELSAAIDGGPDPHEFASQIERVLAALRGHESAANDLVHEALLRDIGGSG